MSVRSELKSAKPFKFRGAVARATPLGVPSREGKRPFHLQKRTSLFIYRGEMHFDGQKMGKLQVSQLEVPQFFRRCARRTFCNGSAGSVPARGGYARRLYDRTQLCAKETEVVFQVVHVVFKTYPLTFPRQRWQQATHYFRPREKLKIGSHLARPCGL